jgi:UDP-N-acetylmuramate dehydrogenase
VTIRPALSEHTTLRVGGAPDSWIIVDSEPALVEAVARADRDGVPVLILGGGSNLLVADAGFPGAVIEVSIPGITPHEDASSVDLVVGAGEQWDDVVALAVARGWSGIEALSGIPGRSGATPIQNVGAYGQDVSQVVTSVRAFDRRVGSVVDLTPGECGFGYRTSVFKRDPDRWVIVSLTMRLALGGLGTVRYGELARALGVRVGATAPVGAIRTEVLSLRSGKGMVLDEADHDTWSAGSFFMNPVVSADVAAAVPEGCPRYPADEGVKLSAAWLIEDSGMFKGYALTPTAPVAISSRHTLALTNRGGAHAEDVLQLARRIRERVEQRHGITLQAEVRLVGCSL